MIVIVVVMLNILKLIMVILPNYRTRTAAFIRHNEAPTPSPAGFQQQVGGLNRHHTTAATHTTWR
jgi:hypothetical protein